MSSLILSSCHLCCRGSSGGSRWLSSMRRGASCTGRTFVSWLWVSSLPSGITYSTLLYSRQTPGAQNTAISVEEKRLLLYNCFLIYTAESVDTLKLWHLLLSQRKPSLWGSTENISHWFLCSDSRLRSYVCFDLCCFSLQIVYTVAIADRRNNYISHLRPSTANTHPES